MQYSVYTLQYILCLDSILRVSFKLSDSMILIVALLPLVLVSQATSVGIEYMILHGSCLVVYE